MKFGDPQFKPSEWDNIQQEWPWQSCKNPKEKNDTNLQKGRQTELLRLVVTATLNGRDMGPIPVSYVIE